jgi:ABC-2 type transport system permease protein
MIFLCGLFFPIDSLPVFLRPLSYILPLTYGVDILHGAIQKRSMMALGLDFLIIMGFCVILFYISLRNIHRKRIV